MSCVVGVHVAAVSPLVWVCVSWESTGVGVCRLGVLV